MAAAPAAAVLSDANSQPNACRRLDRVRICFVHAAGQPPRLVPRASAAAALGAVCSDGWRPLWGRRLATRRRFANLCRSAHTPTYCPLPVACCHEAKRDESRRNVPANKQPTRPNRRRSARTQQRKHRSNYEANLCDAFSAKLIILLAKQITQSANSFVFVLMIEKAIAALKLAKMFSASYRHSNNPN